MGPRFTLVQEVDIPVGSMMVPDDAPATQVWAGGWVVGQSLVLGVSGCADVCCLFGEGGDACDVGGCRSPPPAFFASAS